MTLKIAWKVNIFTELYGLIIYFDQKSYTMQKNNTYKKPVQTFSIFFLLKSQCSD